ncbi:SUMO1 sentrin specific peptidase 8 [Homalodisca vitripennis]|nr:SUMO1 sentrin specific peptidase 8 [Homalodisca vitripennis]
MPVIEEIFTDTNNLNDDTESLVTSLYTNLKKLEANHPHITLSDLVLNISNLLKRLDESRSTTSHSEVVIKELQGNILTLESRLEKEKQRRRSDLNESFNELDVIREEKDRILRENSTLSSSLTNAKTKLENLTHDCLSLKSLVTDRNSVLDKLKSDLIASNLQNSELTGIVTELRSSIAELEQKSWLNSRWIDDSILDSYFLSFEQNNKDSLSKVVFLGPTLTQLIKHGSSADVNAHLKELNFFNSDYAFLCISDNPLVFKSDTGSHWTLLFVDITGQKLYHLDSLHGSNMPAAKLVTGNLGFSESNLCELNCCQQNNSFECGLSVLVNTKFINDGFCKKTTTGGIRFHEWYKLFTENTSNLSIGETTEPVVIESNIKEIPQAIDDGDKWSIVKHNRTRKAKNKLNRVSAVPIVETKNKYGELASFESEDVHDTGRVKSVSGVWRTSQQEDAMTQCIKSKRCKKSGNVESDVKRMSVIRESNSSKRQRCRNCKSSKDPELTDSHLSLRKNVNSLNSNRDSIHKKSSPNVVNNNNMYTSTLKSCLVIGDSLLRFSSKQCVYRGATVDVNPGAKILNIKRKKLKDYVQVQPPVIYIHVGTNDVAMGYNGGAGYDGGCGKKEVLHRMAELLYTCKTEFPNAKIILNSILRRRDINDIALDYLNEQLFLMCNNFNVEFIDLYNCIRRHHLAIDGRHLNRSGNFELGHIMLSTLLKSTSKRSLSDSVAPILSSNALQPFPVAPNPFVPSCGPTTGFPPLSCAFNSFFGKRVVRGDKGDHLDTLRLVHQNVQGIMPKLAQIEVMVDLLSPQILCFSEHFLRESEMNILFCLGLGSCPVIVGPLRGEVACASWFTRVCGIVMLLTFRDFARRVLVSWPVFQWI